MNNLDNCVMSKELAPTVLVLGGPSCRSVAPSIVRLPPVPWNLLCRVPEVDATRIELIVWFVLPTYNVGRSKLLNPMSSVVDCGKRLSPPDSVVVAPLNRIVVPV